MSRKITQSDVLESLRKIIFPITGNNIVDEKIVSSVVVREHSIGFALELDVEAFGAKESEALREQSELHISKTFNIDKVTAVLTSVKTAQSSQREQKEQLKEVRRAQKERHPPLPIRGVKRIIAVASGKGGVGKSTVSVNLAVALSELGQRVALVDADIYGPSVPHMLGIDKKPEINDKNQMVPLNAHGVDSISIGYLIDNSKATVWRGPMVVKALHQLFRGVAWEDIDVMVIDMPPGTGDIQLSLAENIPVDGVVMVTTPQEVALLDVRKAADMFQKVQLPIIGVVENMSYFENDKGERSYIFGQGGGQQLAEKLDVPLLASVPLKTELREAGDNRRPIKNEIIFKQLAQELLNKL